MNGQLLENVDSEKLIGMTVNNNLSWEPHIQGVIGKINSKLALLRRIKGCLPVVTRQMFSNSHILPYLDYCSTVWGDSPYVQDLLLAQKRVARTILDIKGKAIRDPENRTQILFSKLNWMSIQDRVDYRKATMVYKSLNNLAPEYMTNMFKYATNRQNTRQYTRKELQVPPGKHKQIFEHSFRFSSVYMWNSVKPEICDSCSLNSFKSRYLKDYFKYV